MWIWVWIKHLLSSRMLQIQGSDLCPPNFDFCSSQSFPSSEGWITRSFSIRDCIACKSQCCYISGLSLYSISHTQHWVFSINITKLTLKDSYAPIQICKRTQAETSNTWWGSLLCLVNKNSWTSVYVSFSAIKETSIHNQTSTKIKHSSVGPATYNHKSEKLKLQNKISHSSNFQRNCLVLLTLPQMPSHCCVLSI